MRLTSARSSPDLVAAVVLASVGLALSLASVGGAIELLVQLPIVLVLPGYAATAAFFPPGSISIALRTAYSLALSFGICALAGASAQLFAGLDRAIWAMLLFIVTMAACAVAQWRREGPLGETAQPRFRLPRFSPLALASVLAAVVIASWAISIASGGAREQQDEARFAAIWVLPREGGGRVTIGVANHIGRRTAFQVRATRKGRLLSRWRLSLDDGRRWQTSLSTPPASRGKPLLVTLFKEGELYRRAYLRSEPGT